MVASSLNDLVLARLQSSKVSRQLLQRCSGRRKYSSVDAEAVSGPLEGIKILDFTRILAGPFCTQILADYGADVIKVEVPKLGDETRSWQGKGEAQAWKPDLGPISIYYAAINRNKRSLTLDLKKPKALEIVKKLASEVDVVVENFVPGTADRLGVGYDALSKVNPRLIYASLSGYGSSGPYSKRAGYDAIAAAEGGLMHVTGHPDAGPVRPGLGMTDMATGLYTHGAIMAALYNREHTRRGQHISTSLFETQISLLINIGGNWLNLGVEGKRYGAAHPSIVPYNTWKCKDDIWLALAANNDRQFEKLCNLIDRTDFLSDARFATNAKRVENRSLMEEALDKVFASKTSEEWIRILDGSGLAHGPVNTIQKAFEHPQVAARDMMQPLEWDAMKSGEWKSVGIPVKFSDTKGTIRRRPAKLGEHSHEVLQELGYDEGSIAKMRDEGVI
ncbi:CoA-transferase family III [Teratosphaeria destructans]|uniref:CoA-transferase family III n=1 Tax=Teratosphaeria destructans TaxID=418781 RepID=A0A9W7T1W4_9PEZI|nr:CoA-transferase family III [Teratosphaeria destructans]